MPPSEGAAAGGVGSRRAMGVDYGERRVGVAVSDETATLASPLPTLQRRRGKRPPVHALAELGRSHGVHAVVFGLPLELNGEESEWTREVREVGAALGERLGVPVYFVDERMTSVVAEQRVRSSGLPLQKRQDKARVDAEAAVIILQRWLDQHSSASAPVGGAGGEMA